MKLLLLHVPANVETCFTFTIALMIQAFLRCCYYQLMYGEIQSMIYRISVDLSDYYSNLKFNREMEHLNKTMKLHKYINIIVIKK